MSDDALFRRKLVRRIGDGPTLCVAMQNPSTARAEEDGKNDQTINRLVGFCERLGYGKLVVVNWSFRRATHPHDLYNWLRQLDWRAREDHFKEALEIAVEEASKATLFVAAWGAGHYGEAQPREFAFKLRMRRVDLYAFGLTHDGRPKHPLARGRSRLPDGAKPFLWLEALKR